MPNGDCPVGAENKTKVDGLNKEQREQNRRITKVEGKIDQLIYLVVTTLAGVAVNLILLLVQGNGV